MLVLCYPKCSTCQKALAWLNANKIKYEERDIVKDRPKQKELREWREKSGLPMKRFFNTSGLKYKELGLAKKLPEMKESEMIRLLASDGMLVKRPLVVADDGVLLGFREEEWKALKKTGRKKT